MRELPIWTRDDVAARILEGETIFIRHGRVLRVPPSWLEKHPGGALAILHFVGRDASDETDAYHPDETLAVMDKYTVAQLEPKAREHGWSPLVPPVASGWLRRAGQWCKEAIAVRDDKAQIMLYGPPNDIETKAPQLTRETLEPTSSPLDLEEQYQLHLGYQALHKQIRASGLYQCPYLAGYGPEFARYTMLAAIAALAYWRGWFVVSAAFLGIVWHQLAFFAHDLGHNGMTHNWYLDRAVGIFIANFLGGESLGWWVDVSFLCVAFFLHPLMIYIESQHSSS